MYMRYLMVIKHYNIIAEIKSTLARLVDGNVVTKDMADFADPRETTQVVCTYYLKYTNGAYPVGVRVFHRAPRKRSLI